MKPVGLRVGVCLTALYVLVVFVLFGSKAWTLAPNELGDFLAGVFTPLALGWLVYGYFLQTRELSLQRQELEETRNTLREQVELLRKRDETEYQRSLPCLKLEGVSVSGAMQWRIQNNGALARELKVFLDNIEQSLQKTILDADKEMEVIFSVPDGESAGESARSFRCEARFTSVRQEKLHQIWEIKRTGEADPTFEVKELTNGPEPLEG